MAFNFCFFQMKVVFTSKRTAIIITGVYIIFVSNAAPLYIVNKLETKFFPERNKTLFALVYGADRDKVQKISFIINSFIMPLSAFVVIVICTILLVTYLQNNSRWHKTSASSLVAATSRNQRVVKMVVMISSLFISCFLPMTIIMLVVAFEPEIAVGGKDFYIGMYLSSAGVLMESINSSVNIFIYYNMGSKYRNAFTAVFCKPLSIKQ